MMHRQKVKLLLWFATLLSVLALVVAPVLAIDQFTLTVEKAGDGTGTVTSDPAGINCGAVCQATFGGTDSVKLMSTGVIVTLTATPDEGSVFTGWGQDCGCGQPPANDSGGGFDPGTGPCEMLLDANRTCTATFGLPVGGLVVPVNKLGLLAPWLGMAALASLAALTVALVRRRRGV